MTPLLWPGWWAARSVSFSRRIRLARRPRYHSARAAASATMPPPTMQISVRIRGEPYSHTRAWIRSLPAERHVAEDVTTVEAEGRQRRVRKLVIEIVEGIVRSD